MLCTYIYMTCIACWHEISPTVNNNLRLHKYAFNCLFCPYDPTKRQDIKGVFGSDTACLQDC